MQIRKDDVIVEMLTLEMCQLLCLATQTRETSPRDAYTALHEALQVLADLFHTHIDWS